MNGTDHTTVVLMIVNGHMNLIDDTADVATAPVVTKATLAVHLVVVDPDLAMYQGLLQGITSQQPSHPQVKLLAITILVDHLPTLK